MAEAEHRQRFMKEDRHLRMQYYAIDAREKEQRDLEAKRAADEERIRQARVLEDERRAHEQRFASVHIYRIPSNISTPPPFLDQENTLCLEFKRTKSTIFHLNSKI